MAGRSKRDATNARPGNVVNDAKQKRRTKAEIARDNLAKKAEKETKAQEAAKKKDSGVKRIAAAEDEIRRQDEHARATAARPDLFTAQLKRLTCAAPPPPILSRSTATEDEDLTMDDVNNPGGTGAQDDDEAMGSGGEGMGTGGDSDRDGDPDYVESDVERGLESPGQNADEDSGDADHDMDDDNDDIQAQIAAFAQKLKAKKQRERATKARPQKGALRSEIQIFRELGASSGSKRKHVDGGEPALTEPTAKKPKAMAGGLKANWQKEVGLPKPVKKSTTSWNRSVSRASSTSATTPEPSATSSVGDVLGEFDREEDESTMGITLKTKTVVVDVNGKTKTEPKRRYTNADLPFPPDGHAADLKHYQETFIPDLTDWAATLDDPFVAHNHLAFKSTVANIWTKYFSAYKIDASVEYMATSALGNWRSDIGKRAIKAVVDRLDTLGTARARRDWVAEQSFDLAFLYRDPATKAHLFLQTFAAHLRIVMKTDVSYGHPTGAASLCAAALERALSLCQTGSLNNEGQRRNGKKSVLSFVAEPWAERAANYLPPIKTLTLQKWQEIFNLASAFQTSKGKGFSDIFDYSADGTDSSDGYLDPRSRVVVSDDEDEDNPGDDHPVRTDPTTPILSEGGEDVDGDNSQSAHGHMAPADTAGA
ncbi:hypothetical protein DFH09DRAFT_1334473 [Mycena vulgaris]|nr:hypothetical protein DFH09DRAFT_1334473 [Mycena vulgaris]